LSSVGFISLGCPKALVDSERILTSLRQQGYRISPSYQGANVVIVNTCGFIDSARTESLEAIGEAINENGRVIVTGCLGVNAEKIRKIHPRVLHISGPQQYDQVINAVLTHAPIDKIHDPYIDLMPPQGIKLTPGHYAYLKIAEGCNHQCSFCIIPSMRGALVSRRLGDVMAEAARLVQAGVKELLVISQDTSAYGADLKYLPADFNGHHIKTNIHDLCMALGELGVWVRLHYVYPYPHVDKLIPLMADGKVLPYLDVPFQHGSPRILKLMRRPAAAENNLERIHSWREICPDINIRSTFIVGFPGETDKDFEALLDFLEQARLDRVGCFQYSPVEGARANQLPGHVDDQVKQQRWDYFMQTQANISRRKLKSRVGRQLEVIIDEVNNEELVGRSFADAPHIDGKVFIRTQRPHKTGDIVTVRIEKSDNYDLWGSVLENGPGVA
jgi:ribosomal protein S12 methylthiotransferase